MSATYKPVTLNCSCRRHIINILLIELSRSVWENLDLGRVYRPHCVRSVLTTSVKILPYRPPARLIRANYLLSYFFRLSTLKGAVKTPAVEILRLYTLRGTKTTFLNPTRYDERPVIFICTVLVVITHPLIFARFYWLL